MRQGVSIDEPLHFEVIAGGGLFAKVMDSQNIEREILIGSEKLMIKNKILLPEILDDEPVTKVYVAIDGKIVAVFSITDPLREETLEIVNDLKKMGIKIVILTGDNERTAQAVAKKLGIEEYFAGVLPNEKAKVVRKFRVEKRKIVGMIGDGINDAPALAESNIGIAMGGGTDIAIHTADVTLIKGGLKGVPSLIRLSKLTLKTIKENLFWAFIYNIVGIPIAAGVLYIFGGPLLNPMIASLAMSLSSVSVVSNSLRLKRRSGKEFF
jgi:P-type E1-E2 ATPase